MTTLKASRLQALLAKAKNTGQVEETVTLAGLEVTFRSLTPEDYVRLSEDLENVSDGSYGHMYQQEMVCRGLVEIEGEDFRDVDFIEVEKIDPASRQPVMVKVERHQWILDNIVKTWSSATVLTAFKKVMDTIAASEAKAVEGVEFRVESETDEDKFRRLLSELQEIGSGLPEDMREAILKSNGLLTATSQQELEALNERSKEWLERSSKQEIPEPQEPPRAPLSLKRAVEQPPQEESPEPEYELQQLSPEDLMASRSPLNREAIQPPIPNAQSGTPRAANHRSPPPPPDQVHSLSGRALEVAQLEGIEPFSGEPQVLPGRDEPEILERRPAVGGDVSSNFKVPKPGVNPKYVDPRKRPPAQGLNPRRR